MNSSSNVAASFGIGSGVNLGRSFGGIGQSIINNNSMSSRGPLVPHVKLHQLQI
jgi:hypothetical protein